MSLHALATHMAQTGRGPDSMLVHMSPREVQSLQALAKANGGELTINPHTGLPEAGFLEKLLPAIAGAAAMYFTGGAAAPEIIAGMSNPATLGLGAAALGKASGKSIAESIQLGMGVYGGAGLAGLASTAGTAAISAGATPAIASPVVPAAGAETALAGGLPSGAANSAIDLGGFDPTKGLPTTMPNAVIADATLNMQPPIGGSEYKLAEAYTPPPAAPVPAPAAPAAPVADVAASPSGINTAGQNTADASLLEGQQQRAVEKALADAGPGETMGRGLKAIASSPGKYMNMETGKMGLAALAPAMFSGSKLTNKPAEGNIREFDFDPITGKYRKLRTTPASQYNAEGMARGGVTSLLSFAEGGAVSAEEAAAIRATIQAGPQTQTALDQAFVTYTPAQLSAAFPEFGDEEAYKKAAAKSKEDAAADSSRETASGAGSSTTLSADDEAYIDWMLAQPNPYGQGTIADIYKSQGVNPRTDTTVINQAKQANVTAADRADFYKQNGQVIPWYDHTDVTAGVKPWSNPNWKADMATRAATLAARDAAQTAASPGVGVGPFGGGPTGGTTGGGTADNTRAGALSMDKASSAAPATSKAQLQSYYNTYFSDTKNVPVGSTQAWAGGRITKISPTEAQYVPPGGGKAISLTQGMDIDKIIQLSPDIAKQWNSEYGYSYTPQSGSGNPAGPRVGTVTGSSTPTDKATMQGYYDQYFTSGVPVGYSQSWGGGQLVKNSANTAVYTDSRGNSHIMEKGMDVNSVYSMSPDIAAQWNNEFLYTANPDQRNPNAGPTTTATLTPFSAPSNLTSPYSFSKQGAMTPQGVMGGSEKGGTIANASQIVPAYQQYWQNAPVGSTVDFAGGKLSRTGGAQAVYTGADGKTYSLSPTSDLNIIAAQNPAIAETWRNEFGMVPQNYMTGESARNFEFLKGNEPYSVNQQTRGIARPYGEMALGLPGPTFGEGAMLNRQDIIAANAANAAEGDDFFKLSKNMLLGKDGKVVVPEAQYGYGVTDPGTYNMQTVYDPGTQRYVSNNMYETPGQTKADAAAAAAIPTKVAGGGLMALGGMTGISSLGDYSDGGRLLRGPGDGVSDSIPAMIGNKQQARLADGEFVVPARIVSELGNGSTEAGARQLYAMMDRIQKNRSKTIGKNNVAVNSKAAKQLPA